MVLFQYLFLPFFHPFTLGEYKSSFIWQDLSCRNLSTPSWWISIVLALSFKSSSEGIPIFSNQFDIEKSMIKITVARGTVTKLINDIPRSENINFAVLNRNILVYKS